MTSHSLCCGFIDHVKPNPMNGGRMKKVSKPRERSNAKDRVEAYKELVQGDFEFFKFFKSFCRPLFSGHLSIDSDTPSNFNQ